MKSYLQCWGVVLLLIITCSIRAEIINKSSLKIHGRLIVVECSINSGQKQVVNFGDAVGIHRIDGKRYEQPVPFVLDCQNYAGGDMPAMTLTLSGDQTSFDEAAVTTTIKGLGIELKMNGKPLPLSKTVEVDYNNPPELTAVPVADPSEELVEGPFSGGVRLIVEVP